MVSFLIVPGVSLSMVQIFFNKLVLYLFFMYLFSKEEL
jgi:hypothetical protein